MLRAFFHEASVAVGDVSRPIRHARNSAPCPLRRRHSKSPARATSPRGCASSARLGDRCRAVHLHRGVCEREFTAMLTKIEAKVVSFGLGDQETQLAFNPGRTRGGRQSRRPMSRAARHLIFARRFATYESLRWLRPTSHWPRWPDPFRKEDSRSSPRSSRRCDDRGQPCDFAEAERILRAAQRTGRVIFDPASRLWYGEAWMRHR
jgi:hypothetical protein